MRKVKYYILIFILLLFPCLVYASGKVKAPFSDLSIEIFFYGEIGLSILLIVLNLIFSQKILKSLLVIIGLFNLIIGMKFLFHPEYVVIYNLGIVKLSPFMIAIIIFTQLIFFTRKQKK